MDSSLNRPVDLREPCHPSHHEDTDATDSGAEFSLLLNVRFWPRPDFDRRYTWSNLGLLCHFQGVVDLNPKISNGALQLRMAKQKLNGPQVLCPAIDQ